MLNVLVLLPLLAPAALALVALVARTQPGRHPHRVVLAGRLASYAGLALAVLAGGLVAVRGPLDSPTLGVAGAGFALRLDALSVVMFGLVAFLGAAVLRYSRNYLDGDARHGDFLGRLALTIAAVMLLVLAGNLLQLAVMWSLTSFALHRLLVFYPDRPAAVRAARKKFIVARLGDVALLAAAVLIARAFGSWELGVVLERARLAYEAGAAPAGVAAAGLLVAATAILKSAQFPVHGWLAEVMETPTPVSALLHAGILNGGPFIVVRLAPVVLLSPPSLWTLILVGGVTALFASLVMITQTSIKVSLAYSSAAHMGFMLFLCGLGAYPVAILHLVAHSFYKAHAFLSSGSAVDVTRASQVPGGKPARGALQILASLGLALALVIGLGALVGASLDAQPIAFTLAVVLAIGLMQLLAQAVHAQPSAYVLGATTLAAVGTALAFFLLEAGATRVLHGTVPELPLPDGAVLVLASVVVAGFGLASLLQLLLPARVHSPGWAAVYVHLRNGLYANALFDRLVGLPRPAAIRHPSPEQP